VRTHASAGGLVAPLLVALSKRHDNMPMPRSISVMPRMSRMSRGWRRGSRAIARVAADGAIGEIKAMRSPTAAKRSRGAGGTIPRQTLQRRCHEFGLSRANVQKSLRVLDLRRDARDFRRATLVAMLRLSNIVSGPKLRKVNCLLVGSLNVGWVGPTLHPAIPPARRDAPDR
jgi:hypothetical protein